jgi:hypothetical protein
MQMLLLLQH